MLRANLNTFTAGMISPK